MDGNICCESTNFGRIVEGLPIIIDIVSFPTDEVEVKVQSCLQVFGAQVMCVMTVPHCKQVLGYGELSDKLQVKAAKFSKSALEKIEAKGGKAIVIPQRPKYVDPPIYLTMSF